MNLARFADALLPRNTLRLTARKMDSQYTPNMRMAAVP
jgi:hypothetical protein